MSLPIAAEPSRVARLLFHLAFAVPLVSLSLSALFYAIGQQAVLLPYGGLDLRALVGTIVVVGGLYIVGCAATNRIRMDAFGGFLWAFIGYATALGLVHLLMQDPEYTWRAFTPHLSAGLLILCGYAVFALDRGDLRGWMASRLPGYSAASLLVVAAYLAAFIADWQRNNTYWGPSTGTLLIPAAWYLATKRTSAASISALLIILNGKRGPAVALVVQVAIALWIASQHSRATRRSRLPVLISAFLVGGLALGATVWTVRSVDAGTASPILEATVFKWRYLNTRSGDFDIDVATAGRSIETREAVNELNEEPIRWILGAGYGWTFTLFGGDETLHYLHFSPMNLVMQYGLPLTIIFFAAVLRILKRAVNALRIAPDPVLLMLTLLVVASLVEGLFAYMYAVNPLIWFGLGAIAGCLRHRARQQPFLRPILAMQPAVV